jgi:hypothetical protein
LNPADRIDLAGKLAEAVERGSQFSSSKSSKSGDGTIAGTIPSEGPGRQSILVDPVEEALARAIEGATAAQRWDVVTQLATELAARRTSRSTQNGAVPKPHSFGTGVKS